MKRKKETQHLDNFIGAYFNQDCDIFGETTIDEVITEYLNSEPPIFMKGLIEDIDYFISNSKDVEKDFDNLGHEFYPELWETTALDFLNHVSKRVRNYLKKEV
ncbi:contact-dependent growth inhibition system immunity protein [Photorhabdus sp. P32]|uniref:contact-dependent growth inhibition system immunity protein n=1 Tax=Photorhabdus sp. P32 TaxID=3117549 RepID=UPI00311B32C6